MMSQRSRPADIPSSMAHRPSLPTSPSTTFGTHLRQYRKRAGLTQEALADQAGLTTNAISALERGEPQRPYPHTVQALADALQLSADERTTLLAARATRRGAALPAPNLAHPRLPCHHRCRSHARR